MKHYMWIQYDISLLCSNDNSMFLLRICNWALQQLIIGVWRKPRQPPIMPKTQEQISRAHESCRQYWIRCLMLSLILWIKFVGWMLRISDFIRNNEFELLFFIQTCKNKKSFSFWFLSVYFVVLGNLTDLCLTWTCFFMISGNPSSKCQRVWP